VRTEGRDNLHGTTDGGCMILEIIGAAILLVGLGIGFILGYFMRKKNIPVEGITTASDVNVEKFREKLNAMKERIRKEKVNNGVEG